MSIEGNLRSYRIAPSTLGSALREGARHLEWLLVDRNSFERCLILADADVLECAPRSNGSAP